MTVGSRVMRTCCGRMLKFIRCVRNKYAVSSYVGFGGDRRSCRLLIFCQRQHRRHL